MKLFIPLGCPDTCGYEFNPNNGSFNYVFLGKSEPGWYLSKQDLRKLAIFLLDCADDEDYVDDS